VDNTVYPWERSALTAILVRMQLNMNLYYEGWQQALAVIPPKEVEVSG